MSGARSTARTIEVSRALGFDLCGVAPATDFPELAHLRDWLGRGHAGEMRYLEDPRRRSPSLAMLDARSVIVCALNYNAALPASIDIGAQVADATGPRGWVSRYALGDDYPTELRGKLS